MQKPENSVTTCGLWISIELIRRPCHRPLISNARQARCVCRIVSHSRKSYVYIFTEKSAVSQRSLALAGKKMLFKKLIASFTIALIMGMGGRPGDFSGHLQFVCGFAQ
jgi:hypothetical protein